MKIGILGGGQLSKMLALAGIPMGMSFIFYFPAVENSLGELGKIIQGDYHDWNLLKKFADEVDVITYENENIPIKTIEYLENLKPVYPDKKAIAISQDRWVEKNFFLSIEIPTNQFIAIHEKSDIDNAVKTLGFPLILKKRTQGYDGKGQYKINKIENIKNVPYEYFDNTIAEECVFFDREVSFIMARNNSGSVRYDICENFHKNGILIKTRNIKNDPIFDLAYNYVAKIMDQLKYRGVLTVEFFQVGNKLIANEIAPRVHNSGHWTIDACITSQFQNHLRAIAGFPLGDTKSLAQAIMFNILNKMPEKIKLLEFSKICLHDYGKKPAHGRKLGHITLVENESSEIVEKIESILY